MVTLFLYSESWGRGRIWRRGQPGYALHSSHAWPQAEISISNVIWTTYSLLWLSGSGNHPLLKSYAIASTLDLGSTPNSESVNEENESPTDLGKDAAGTEESVDLIMIIIPLVLTLVIIAVVVCVVVIYRRGRTRDAGMSGCIQTDQLNASVRGCLLVFTYLGYLKNTNIYSSLESSSVRSNWMVNMIAGC